MNNDLTLSVGYTKQKKKRNAALTNAAGKSRDLQASHAVGIVRDDEDPRAVG